MDTMTAPAPLRAKLGLDASEGLVEMFAAYHQCATDRFERRLALEGAALRVEMERMRGDLRGEIAGLRGDLMRWTLLLWVGQFAAMVGVLSYMLPTR